MQLRFLYSAFLFSAPVLFGMESAPAYALDTAEEALLEDSAKNDQSDEQEAYQRAFNRREAQRVAEIERREAAKKILAKKRGAGAVQPADVSAYLASHQGAKTALTPPPSFAENDGDGVEMPPLSAQEAKEAAEVEARATAQALLTAQLVRAQKSRQKAARSQGQGAAEGEKASKGFLLGMDPAQKVSSRYFGAQGFSGENQNTGASSYGQTGKMPAGKAGSEKWKSQIPGLPVDELLGETQGSLIDALEMCPPSAAPDKRFDVCLKHHSPPQWWLADLKRSAPKLLIEKWKALKTIKVKEKEDPLAVYANWLADQIPEEFKNRHEPELIEALQKPQTEKKQDIYAALEKPQQPLTPPPLNLAEAREALAANGGLQKPQRIPSLNEEKNAAHQKKALLADRRTESYIGEDDAQYLYPVSSPNGKASKNTPKAKEKYTPPPVAGVEAYRDE